MSGVHSLRPQVSAITLQAALAGISSAALLAPGKDGLNTLVCGVTVDNRDCEPGWVFVATSGAHHHGINFAPQAIAAGASAVLTDSIGHTTVLQNSQLQTALQHTPLIAVDNPRKTAAQLAKTIHNTPAQKLKTFAVTGTNGKTTTSYLMRSILQHTLGDTAMCGTVETIAGQVRFNSEKTTSEAPVVYRFLDTAAQSNSKAAVIETSSHALDFHRVGGIVFDVAGFTNLQHDHLDFYGDMETYFRAKQQLFTPAHSKHGVVCVDDEWGQRLAAAATVPVTTFAALSDSKADWQVTDISTDKNSFRTVFTLQDPSGVLHHVAMPIMGRINVQNTVLALISATVLGVKLADAIAALTKTPQIPGRMEMVNPKPAPHEPLVLVDYAHTAESLEALLLAAREMTTGKLIVVFGSEGDRDSSKRAPVGIAAAKHADILWVTDESPRDEDAQQIRDMVLSGVRRIRPDLQNVTEVKTCRRDAVREAILAAAPGDVIVVSGKGAEQYQLVKGVKHAYNDVPVALEALAALQHR